MKAEREEPKKVPELTEAEVRQALEEWYRAYDEKDIEVIAERRFGFEPGFGIRSFEPRGTADWKNFTTDQLRDFVAAWYDTMASYDIKLEDVHIEIHGNTGIAWGTHTEVITPKDGATESIRVRFSQSFQKLSNGKIQSLLCHRDNQDFGDASKTLD